MLTRSTDRPISNQPSAISSAEPKPLNTHRLGLLNAISSCCAWSECTPKPLMIPVNFLRLLGIRYDIKHAEPGLPAPEHGAAELRGPHPLIGNHNSTAAISRDKTQSFALGLTSEETHEKFICSHYCLVVFLRSALFLFFELLNKSCVNAI